MLSVTTPPSRRHPAPARLMMSWKQRVLSADDLRMVNDLFRYRRRYAVARWNPKLRLAVVVGLYEPRTRSAHRVHSVVKVVNGHLPLPYNQMPSLRRSGAVTAFFRRRP